MFNSNKKKLLLRFWAGGLTLGLPRDQMWSLATLEDPWRVERVAMETYESEVTKPTEGVVITCLYSNK